MREASFVAQPDLVHFVRFLRTKPEVSEVVLLTDELPVGEVYDMDLGAEANSCPMSVVPCW